MEEEIETLKKKIVELEKEIAVKDQEAVNGKMLGFAPEPRGLKKQDYEYVEGWKIIDMRIMNEALEIAQKCGHSQVVLVEANRTKMRTGLASHLAYLCISCGSQTVFSSSSFSQEEPSNYVVNKEFSRLGLDTYNSVVELVTEAKTILSVPQDEKILESRPTFLFKYGDSGEENMFVETEQVDPDGTDVKKEINIKEELEDFMEDYLQPSISLTEGEASNFDEIAESNQDVDPLQNPTGTGPQIDVSTITTNTPLLAMSTVQPNTEVLGGKVTPWPPHLLIKIQPSLFIRTTCSKVLLPPGLYSYQRDNGLKSIMVVKADSGTFDSIESCYLLMCKQTNEVNSTGKKVDNRRWDTKVKKTYTSAHRKSPLQLYSQDLQKVLLKEGIPREDWDKEIIDRWARLDKVTKQEYNERALRPLGQSSEPQAHTETAKEQKKTTNIPLPALKKFALEFAPELKKKKPYLAKVENRGQLNKHLLEMWMQLSQEEQNSYKLLAGMQVEDATSSASYLKQQSEPSQEKKSSKKLKKTDSDSDSEYTPTSTRSRKRRKV